MIDNIIKLSRSANASAFKGISGGDSYVRNNFMSTAFPSSSGSARKSGAADFLGSTPRVNTEAAAVPAASAIAAAEYVPDIDSFSDAIEREALRISAFSAEL